MSLIPGSSNLQIDFPLVYCKERNGRIEPKLQRKKKKVMLKKLMKKQKLQRSRRVHI